MSLHFPTILRTLRVRHQISSTPTRLLLHTQSEKISNFTPSSGPSTDGGRYGAELHSVPVVSCYAARTFHVEAVHATVARRWAGEAAEAQAAALPPIGEGSRARRRAAAAAASFPVGGMRHQYFGRGENSVAIELPRQALVDPGGTDLVAPAAPSFLVIFRYGSVVFFNVDESKREEILDMIWMHCLEPIPRHRFKETFRVSTRPSMLTYPLVLLDAAYVRHLDMNEVKIISTVMGKSVAIDHYDAEVRDMLGTFARMNSAVEGGNDLTGEERRALIRIVARNNAVFIDLIGRLGLLDRSDTAWNLVQYDNILTGMQNEFELEGRFSDLEFKLNLIQNNAKFFLEMNAEQKSSRSELVIIALIAVECVLMVADMSGAGTRIFSWMI